MLTASDVAQHNSRDSCWVIIEGYAYDVTDFLDQHPGGPNIVLRYAGKDATKVYEPSHPKGTIEKELSPEKHMGQVDPATLPDIDTSADDQEPRIPADVMPIGVCQNLDDIETVARGRLSRKAWTFFSSAADSLSSLDTNRADWNKVSFRPRVLRNVKQADMRRNVMGHAAQLPVFISPAAQAKLGHPDGELCLARAAAAKGIVYCASSYSSVAHPELAEILNQKDSKGVLAFQLYVPKTDIKDAKKLIDMAKELGCSSLAVTVDSPVIGKREEDERYKAEMEDLEEHPIPRDPVPIAGSDRPVLRGHHSYTLNWEDLKWIRQQWPRERGPLILKGIQTAEDAILAAEADVDGIWLSNHGGRQLDCAPSSIRTLLEIRKFHPEILMKMEIYLDGGVRRGNDIVKALCLGATGVGIGRPPLYGLSAFGTEGVERVLELLSEEIETTMRLLGVTSLDQLNERYVNTRLLELELPTDDFYRAPVRYSKL